MEDIITRSWCINNIYDWKVITEDIEVEDKIIEVYISSLFLAGANDVVSEWCTELFSINAAGWVA